MIILIIIELLPRVRVRHYCDMSIMNHLVNKVSGNTVQNLNTFSLLWKNKQRNTANPPIWEAANRESLTFKWLKRGINCLNLFFKHMYRQCNILNQLITFSPLARKKLCMRLLLEDFHHLRGYTHLQNIYMCIGHTHTHRPYITICCPSAFSEWRQLSGNNKVAVIKTL